MQISQDSVVSIDYTLTNDAGDVIDSSDGREPLQYLHGHSNIIPGLENALAGKSAGDSLKVDVAPAEGYGEIQEALIETVPRAAFQGVDEIEAGMRFQANSAQGPMVVTVKEVSDDTVTVDANHELAGQTLHFDVKITDVREATAQELEHGHVHDGGEDH